MILGSGCGNLETFKIGIIRRNLQDKRVIRLWWYAREICEGGNVEVGKIGVICKNFRNLREHLENRWESLNEHLAVRGNFEARRDSQKYFDLIAGHLQMEFRNGIFARA